MTKQIIRFVTLTIGATCLLPTSVAIAATVETAGVAACALSGWLLQP